MIALNLFITDPIRDFGHFSVIKKVDKKWFNKVDATFQIYKNTYNWAVLEVQIAPKVVTFQVGVFGYHLLFRAARSL